MTAPDREQIRRDVETYAGSKGRYTPAGQLARHCLALLDALEQAERERDAALHRINELSDSYEARLAAVPALVGALEWIANHGGDIHGSNSRDRARLALTTYQARA